MQVTKEMSVGEVVEKHPEAVEVMLRHGLHCVGCHFNPMDTLEGGSRLHGIPQAEFEQMMQEINEAVSAKKASGQESQKLVSLTPRAAQKLLSIMSSEGKAGYALRVASLEKDCGCGSQSFYMEFEEGPGPEDIVEHENGLQVIVSKKTADEIQGTAIDFQESGGFTMRNPNAKQACQCGRHAGA